MLSVLLLATILFPGLPKPQLASNPTGAVAQYRAVKSCGDMTVPYNLDTPHPVLPSYSAVVVDFIIGFDGKVYSPFVLESSLTPAQDQGVLKVVQTWKFRPATCNGVRTDSEGRVTLFRR